MKKNVFALEPETFYHLYNCGINGGMLFFEKRNYSYFLKLLALKTEKVADIYAYCLLPSHFHFLVKTKSELEIRKEFEEKHKEEISKIVSKQFSNLFNSYTQAINKSRGRTGKLFEQPFRRREIDNDHKLIKTLLYIFRNPIKHNISRTVREYDFSSIQDIFSGDCTLVKVEKVIDVFGGIEKLEKYLTQRC